MSCAPLVLPEFVPLAAATVKGFGAPGHRLFVMNEGYRVKHVEDTFTRGELDAEAERLVVFLHAGGAADA